MQTLCTTTPSTMLILYALQARVVGGGMWYAGLPLVSQAAASGMDSQHIHISDISDFVMKPV